MIRFEYFRELEDKDKHFDCIQKNHLRIFLKRKENYF